MKNISTRKIVNIDKVNPTPLWNYKQEDDGVLLISIYKGGQAFDVSSQEITLGVKNSKGQLIEHTEGIVISGSNIDITLNNSIFAVKGKIECELTLKDGDGKMSTATFYLLIGQKILGDDSIASSNMIPALDKLVTDFKERGDNTIDDITKDYCQLKETITNESPSANLQAQINDIKTGKMDKTDIVNNLTTGGADKPLSAEQGKILNSALDHKANKTTLSYVNVIEFGALGDDKDYTEEIQNTINYVHGLNGGTVYIPTGTYRISTPLIIPKNVNVVGDGRSTLLHKVSGSCIFNINKDGATTRNTIKGNIIEKLQLSGYSSRTQEGGAIKVEQAQYIIFRDLQIIHFNGNGIEFYGQCDYTAMENVDISLCSCSPTGRLLKPDNTPIESNIGFFGLENGRCAIINFNINNNERPTPSSTTTADLYLYKCTFKDNDCGIRWNGADLHAVSCAIQCNSLLDVYSESAKFLTDCHFEHHTESFINSNNIKSPLNIILKTDSSINFSNCTFWGNDAINSKYILKALDTSYNISFSSCKATGFGNLLKCECDNLNKFIVNGLDVGLGSVYQTSFNVVSSDSTKQPKKSFINYDNLVIVGLVDVTGGVFKGHIAPEFTDTWNIGTTTNKYNNAYINNVIASNCLRVQEKGIYRNGTTPEGVITADVGSLCLTHSGLYVKESGYGTNIGWVKK